MSDYLPEGVIIQILQKLPVKSLIQCTSVCKLWNSLIKGPDFISTRIAKTSSIHFDADQYSLGFGDQEFKEYIPLHFPFKSGSRFFRAVGYSNGLLCLSHRDVVLDRYEDKFILWNPSIRKSFTLPQPNFAFLASRWSCYDYVGCAFHSWSNDYKVFRMMIHQAPFWKNVEETKIQIEIYSLNLNSWKIITVNPPTCWIEKKMTNEDPSRKAAYVNNALHWIVSYRDDDEVSPDFRNKDFILVFDMKEEVLGKVCFHIIWNHPVVFKSVLRYMGNHPLQLSKLLRVPLSLFHGR